jgi:hypothetical protein
MPHERADLPLPAGIRTLREFGRMLGWGTGDAAARKRAAELTHSEVQAMELTVDIASAWREFYSRELERNPANPSAAGRIELMDRVLELIAEGA